MTREDKIRLIEHSQKHIIQALALMANEDTEEYDVERYLQGAANMATIGQFFLLDVINS